MCFQGLEKRPNPRKMPHLSMSSDEESQQEQLDAEQWSTEESGQESGHELYGS